MEAMAKLITAEDALGALIESLVDPSLAKLRPFASPKVAEDGISKQMEAVAWLYNQYLCQELPNVVSLDWEELCNKAAVRQFRLLKFMSAAKTGVSRLLTLTEQKVKNACEAAKALRNANNSPESLSVTKVCVCLLNVRQDKCVLALGANTVGVWSFIEKGKLVQLSENGAGEGSHIVPSEEELGFMAVQEQTGINGDVLQIEDSFLVKDDINQIGGSTKFYIMSCHGTFDLSPVVKLEKVAWVPLDIAFSRVDGPLVEATDSAVRSTPAVQYFHLRPFYPLVQNWFLSSLICRQHKMRSLEQSKNVLTNERKGAEMQANEKASDSRAEALGLTTTWQESLKLVAPLPNNTPPEMKHDDGCLKMKLPKHEKRNELCPKIEPNKQEMTILAAQTSALFSHLLTDASCPKVEVQQEMAISAPAHAANNDVSLDSSSLKSGMGQQETAILSAEAPLLTKCVPTQAHATTNDVLLDSISLKRGMMPQEKVTLSAQMPSISNCVPPADMVSDMAGCNGYNGACAWNELTAIGQIPTEKNGLEKTVTLANISGSNVNVSVAAAGCHSCKASVGGPGKIIALANIVGSNSSVSLVENDQKKSELSALRVRGSKDVKSACFQEQEEEKARQSKQVVNAVALDMGLSVPDCSPQSSTRVKKREEDHIMDKAAAFLSLKTVFRNISKKRKALSQELSEINTRADLLHKQIAECDTDLAALIGGGKAGLQLAVRLCKTDCEKQTSSSEVSVDQHQQEKTPTECPQALIINQAETNNKKRPFRMLKSSMQELNEICVRNEWPSPSYGIVMVNSHQRHNMYSGKVRIRNGSFELAETGELSDSAKGAKLSAAACMLSTLHLVRARNGML